MAENVRNQIEAVRRAVKIISTGVMVPASRLTAEDLDRQLGLKEGTSFKSTGIRSRFISTSETAASLAAHACRAALSAAGISWDEVDALVAASATMDQALPYNAAMIHAELGLKNHRTTTFDVGASCMSFIAALDVCSAMIEVGRFRRVMIVSSDVSTFTTDRSDLKVGGLFGDGAAACLIGKAEDGDASAILATQSITLSEGVDHCHIRNGGSRFHRRDSAVSPGAFFEMTPKPLYGLVAKELPEFVERLLDDTGLKIRDIDLVVPHQASPLALKHTLRTLGIGADKMVNISTEFGNQVGASLPTALHHGIQRGLPRGAKMLLLGSGAGVTIGGTVLVY